MIEPREAIDRIAAATGAEPGHRTLHAKGRFYEGRFTASEEAGSLCRAGHLQGTPVPVLVRWSNGSGFPRGKDDTPDVRGMAVKFNLPDGSVTDLLGQTAPYFPVRTPEDFVRLVEATRQPWRLPLFLATRPGAAAALLGNARARATRAPRSYAEATYFPVHAYRWVAPDGTDRWVRYRLEPIAPEAGRPAGEFTGRDRLAEEAEARLALAPVAFDLRVTLAGPRDDPHDPMAAWTGERELSAGELGVTSPASDPEAGSVIVFDPTRVVEGIELSDDPILRFRPGAYSVSVERRL